MRLIDVPGAGTDDVVRRSDLTGSVTWGVDSWTDADSPVFLSLANSKPIQEMAAISGPVTVSLPNTSSAGRIFLIKHTGTINNTVTVNGTFDGASGGIVLTAGETLMVESTTTNLAWRVLSRYNSGYLTANSPLSLTVNVPPLTASTPLGWTVPTVVPVQTGTAAVTVTLPSGGTTHQGRVIVIKKTDATTGTVTIDAGTGGLIDTAQTFKLSWSGQAVMLMQTATDKTWQVIATYDGDPGWVSFTPVMQDTTTGSTVTGTTSYARYRVSGKTCWAVVSLTATATSPNGVQVDLPLTARDRLLNCGSLTLSGTATPTDQSGIAYMHTNKSQLICVAYTNGFRAITSGQNLRYSVCYELP